MNITEILVTGYDGDQPVFVVNLAQDTGTTILALANDNDQPTVAGMQQQNTILFSAIRELLAQLDVVRVRR